MDFDVLFWSLTQFYGFWIYKYGGFLVFINCRFKNMMVSYGFWILMVLLFSNLVIESYVFKPCLMIPND
jgi:hypothetical protein